MTSSTRLVTLVVLGAVLSLACESTPRGPRDNLLGWYKMADQERLIPVFKRGTDYYTVAGLTEVLLLPCEVGLEWGDQEYTMAGTTIGFDEEEDRYYITIHGQKQELTRIPPPSDLPEITARAPRSPDDFTGWYAFPWFPIVRFHIDKQGDKFVLASKSLEETSPDGKPQWGALSEDEEIVPLPNELGFELGRAMRGVKLVYNGEFGRYELCEHRGNRNSGEYKLVPLARIKNGDSETIPTVFWYGVPVPKG